MPRVGFAAGVIVALSVVGCFHSDSQRSSGDETSPDSPSATEPVTTSERGGVTAGASTFDLTAQQAQEVRVVVQFIDAFNAQRFAEAMALFGPDPVVSDCDYRRIKAVEFTGRREVANWLRERFADHDRLEISRVANQNPDQPVGVVAVEYARRTSDTLRALGFGAGIEPQLATKVLLTNRGPVSIRTFANGPVGGSPESCRPG